MSRMTVAEMIEELRRELETAVKAGKGKEIRFGLGEVTVEAQVEVKKAAKGKAGVKFWLADTEASGEASKTVTHKLVLKLEPQRASGGKLRLGRGADD